MFVAVFSLLVAFTAVSKSQVYPSSFSYVTKSVVTTNGSSAVGHCSNVSTSGEDSTCTTPTTSVLFDGNIPTLTALDGNNTWASQLLILQNNMDSTNPASITFNFTATPNYVRIARIEVVMFNCLEWSTAVQTIQLLSSTPSATLATINILDIASCESLVRVCISHVVSENVLTLQFIPDPDANWLHLAEVTFYGSNPTCPPNTIIPSVETTSTSDNPDSTDSVTTPTQQATLSTTASQEDNNTTSLITTTAPQEDNNTTSLITSTSSFITTDATTTTAVIEAASPFPISNIIIIAVVAVVVVLLLVCVVLSTLILCRCYHAKQHKNRYRIEAKEETHISLEKGSLLGDLSSSEPNLLTQDSTKPQDGGDKQVPSINGEEEVELKDMGVGHYSTLYEAQNSDPKLEIKSQHYAQLEDAFMEEDQEKDAAKNTASYSAVDETEMLSATAAKTLRDDLTPQSKFGPHPPEVETIENQLYAQVGEKHKMEQGGGLANSHTPEADTQVDQLYAQVDKKGKEKKESEIETDNIHSPGADTPADLYAQVDKKDKKKGEGMPDDQLYAQVGNKQNQEKEVEEVVISNQEGDTDVEQLYALVDKRKKTSKEEEVCEEAPKESEAEYAAVNKPHTPQVPPMSNMLKREVEVETPAIPSKSDLLTRELHCLNSL